MNGDLSLPLVIVNPKSASGATRDKWAQTASVLRTHFGPFGVALTQYAGDATVLAAKAAAEGRTFIIACGGDGTINEVANGILASGKDVELGVLPSGTGGDFRRTLGVPQSTPEAAVALKTGVTKWIDVGKVTFRDFQGRTISRHFLNVSSFGLAATIIKRVKAAPLFKWLPVESIRGRASFAVSSFREVWDAGPLTIRYRIDDGKLKTINSINFCVANSRYFGGGMMIAPNAKLDDGLLDVVNIGEIGMARIIMNGYRLYHGTHLGLPEIKSSVAKRIEVFAVDASQEIRIETDGELPGMLPATFEIVPKALRVRVPRE